VPKTIKDMRIGSRLMLGSYSVNNDVEPDSISWLKATPNCDFISTYVIDQLCFDAKELCRRENGTTFPGSGNSDYALSNINSFLNSTEVDWYVPSHANDNAPATGYQNIGDSSAAYKNHYGFLHHFEDYEISNLVAQTMEINGVTIHPLIRLPLLRDIIGDDRFNVFRKRGLRPHPSYDLIRFKYQLAYEPESFAPFWLANKYQEHSGWVLTVNRTGSIDRTSPQNGCGIRPVCRIRPDAGVEEIADSVFQIIPVEPNPISVGTEDEIMSFLGLM